MITINLLPPELRVHHTKSSKQLLVILASVFIGLIPFIYLLYIHFYVLVNTELKLQEAKNERESLRGAEAENAKLQKLIASFKVRDQAIDSVKALRVSFSKKLYEFSNLLTKSNPPHPIWVTNLNITPKKVAKATPQRGAATAAISQSNLSPTFEWRSSCTCASDYLDKPNAFYSALKSDKDFYKDILEIEVFRYTRSSIGGNYRQKISWNFDLKMLMQIDTSRANIGSEVKKN